METAYKDLEDYGIIGNLETCALVGRDGSVVWLCFPFLESPSVFAALLDAKRGGHFWIRPVSKYTAFQSYLPDTNVLQTTFSTAMGIARLTDFMPLERSKGSPTVRTLFRRIEGLKGQVELGVSFQPRFDYAREFRGLEYAPDGLLASGKSETLLLQAPIRLAIGRQEAKGQILLPKDQTLWLVLLYNHQKPYRPADCEKELKKVARSWRSWTHRCIRASCVLEGPWHDLVVRSGLVLKLLSNPETGAIAAAPTTSLPEIIGGVRNWDYRYAWIRDASFTVQALFHLGHRRESRDFRRWNHRIIEQAEDPSRIRVLYGLHGEGHLRERVLENLSGYRGSRPVRIGNGAVKQRQLDLYGELVNALYETTRYGEEISRRSWPMIRKIVNFVCQAWKKKDSGIWEIRGGARHFVYSKLMCWAAMDKGITIARLKGFKAPLAKWEKAKEEIRQAILRRGFNHEINSFVQSFDSGTLDATSLLIPFVGFLPFEDPRVQGTIEATLNRLMNPDGTVLRYEGEDGLPGTEGAFLLCSFWLVKTLALSGKVEKAEELFSRTLNFISPLGLLAEEIDRKTGKQLGNFPQAFSHIGLINAALYLGIAKGRKHKGPKPVGVG
jgi:GH15 family glucan-1,4-alpha-glucosidase